VQIECDTTQEAAELLSLLVFDGTKHLIEDHKISVSPIEDNRWKAVINDVYAEGDTLLSAIMRVIHKRANPSQYAKETLEKVTT
jgi:hypothetical protein